MIDKKILCLIPARGGSKGIPKKNVKPLNGKPLIAWTIDEARKSQYISKIIVSTDDKEIADVACRSGAESPFVRPAELATDSAKSIDVALHAISMIQGYDWILLLQPTSPLRTCSDIDGIIEKTFESNAVSAVSISQVLDNPYWMYTLDDKLHMRSVLANTQIPTRRQDLPSIYVLNGAMYFSQCEWLQESRTLVGENTIGYTMPRERSVDLDTMEDWAWVEYLQGNGYVK